MLLFNNEGNLNGLPPGGKGADAGAGAGGVVKDVYDTYLPIGGKEILSTPDALPTGLKPEDAAKLAAVLSPKAMQALSAVSLAKYLAPFNPLTQKSGQAPGVDLYGIVSEAADKRAFDLLAFQTRLRCWELLNLVYALACNWQDYPGPNGTQAQVQKLVDQTLSWLPPKGSLTGDTWRNVVSSIPTLVKNAKAAEVEYMKAQVTVAGEAGGIGFLLSEAFSKINAVQWLGPVACDPKVAKPITIQQYDQDAKKMVSVDSLEFPIADLYMPYLQYNPSGNKQALVYGASVPGLADYKLHSLYAYKGSDANVVVTTNPLFSGTLSAVQGSGWDVPADKWGETLPGLSVPVASIGYEKLAASANAEYIEPSIALADFLHHQWDRIGGKPFVDAFKTKQPGAKIPVCPEKGACPPAFHPPFEDETNRLYSEKTLGMFIWKGLSEDPEWSSEYGGVAKTPHQVADIILPLIRIAQDAKRLTLMQASLYAKKDNTDPNKPTYPIVKEEGGPWAKVKTARDMLVAAIEFVCFLPPMEVGWTYEPYTTPSGKVITDVAPKLTLLVNKWYSEVKGTTAYANFQSRVAQINKDCLGSEKLDPDKLLEMMGAWPVESIVVPTYTKKQLEMAVTISEKADFFAGKVFTPPRASKLSGNVAKLYAWQPDKSKPMPIPLGFKLVADKVMELHKQATEEAKAQTAGLTEPQKAYVDARSEVKSQLLLGMMASQLASESQDLSEDMIVALNDMAIELYGCSIPDPPKTLTDPQAKLDYYKQTMTECAKNPKKGSLAYKLNELLVEYAKLKERVDAGDQTAIAALNAVSAKISELQAKMAALASLRGARRNRLLDNTTDKGGVLSNLDLSSKALGEARKHKDDKISLNLGGGTIVVVPLMPDKEKAKAEETKEQNDKTKEQVENALDYVAGSGEALQALGQDYNLPIPPAVSETIKKNEEVATKLVISEEEKKPFPWLWLLLGGAVAYSQSKK